MISDDRLTRVELDATVFVLERRGSLPMPADDVVGHEQALPTAIEKLRRQREGGGARPVDRRLLDVAFADAAREVPGRYDRLRVALERCGSPEAVRDFHRLMRELTDEIGRQRRQARLGLPRGFR